MKEVSCKALTVFFKAMKKQNLPLDILCKDLPYNLDYLQNGKNNIEWDVFRKICQNGRAIWKEDNDFVELGKLAVELRVIPMLSAFLGFFLDTKGMYRFMVSNKKGLNSQIFSNITSTLIEIDDNNLELITELSEKCIHCREFYLISQGIFIAAPKLLKYQPANVHLEETEKGAVFKISFTHQKNLSVKLRQLVSLPSSRKLAVKELNDAYELLSERYNQLEESRGRIQKQAKQIETAFSISQLAGSELDLDFMLRDVSESLINIADFAAVEINVLWNEGEEEIKRTIRAGNISEKRHCINRRFEAHSYSLGEINVWLHTETQDDDAEHLLDHIIPPITMGLLNVVSFKLLDDYRNKVKQNVDDIRSAIFRERLIISSDLHDDLGSGLSKIALLSEQVKMDPNGEQSKFSIEKIALSAQQALQQMSDIVWTMNHRNDKLENMIAYIRKYAMEYFEHTDITCKMVIPEKIIDVEINGEQRRNIFLAVKEALHNIVKHADAKNVLLKIDCAAQLAITISDDGKGFEVNTVTVNGNGIINMQTRMEAVSGIFKLENNDGTTITFIIPLEDVG
ncbi:MAG: ATP-binding protein [Bacteroidota bacterium]